MNRIVDDPEKLRFKSTQYVVGEGYHFGSTSALECDENAETLDTLLVGSFLYMKKSSVNESVPVWQRRTGSRSVSFDRVLFFHDPHSGSGRNVFAILGGRGNNENLFSDNSKLRVSFIMFISLDLIVTHAKN